MRGSVSCPSPTPSVSTRVSTRNSVGRNCAQQFSYCAELPGNYRARYCAHVKYPCIGNPRQNANFKIQPIRRELPRLTHAVLTIKFLSQQTDFWSQIDQLNIHFALVLGKITINYWCCKISYIQDKINFSNHMI